MKWCLLLIFGVFYSSVNCGPVKIIPVKLIPIPSEIDLKCLDNHLKYLNNEKNVHINCSFYVDLANKDLYNQLEDIITKDPGLGLISKCIMEKLKYPKILTEAFGLKNHQFSTDFQLLLAAGYCKNEKRFSKIFDKIENEDYCIRKHIIDNKLMNYSLKLNPHNLDTSEINCNEIFPVIRLRVINSEINGVLSTQNDPNNSKSAPYVQSIIKNIMADDKISDSLLVVTMLHQIELNDELREKERQKFVDVLMNLTNKTIRDHFASKNVN